MSKKAYKEININDKLFGPNFILYKWDETEFTNELFLKSKKENYNMS